MKLLNRYNQLSLLATIVVMLITGVVYYFTISYILTAQVDKELVVEEHEIFDYVKANNKLPQVFSSEHLDIIFKPIGRAIVKRHFVDVNYRHDPHDAELETGRSLISSVKVNGVNYHITIIKSTVETEDLIQVIFFITLGIIAVLILVLIIINRWVIGNLWLPFYDMLKQIKRFNLTDQTSITALQTPIDEFKDMNEEISAMAARVQQDYLELKRFIENAAHELMTPVAVINSKLDTLIQTGDLSEKQAGLITDVYTTIGKLTRLNRAMLLLTKIENKLINEHDRVNLKTALEEVLSEFQEIFASRELTLHIRLGETKQSMSKVLADILLNNLLSNAVRHNMPGGNIIVILTADKLEVQNTGATEGLDPQIIFQRFHKSAQSEGSGLGLTLAKQICDNNCFKLNYSYQSPYHTFGINF